jgi:hypothetical protein
VIKVFTPYKNSVSFVGIENNTQDRRYNLEHYVFDESEQREILLWFKKHKPEIWMEVFCEDFPEVLGKNGILK